MLMMACTDEVTLQILESAKTDALPSGDARLAWVTLSDLHLPKIAVNQYELEQKFRNCELKSESKNPDEWLQS